MALKTFSKDVGLGTVSGVSGTLRLTVWEDSTDINGNYSNCSYSLDFIVSPSGYTWRASSGSWGMSGDVSNSGSIASMSYYSGTTTLASGTFTKGHSSDGSGSFSINFSFSSSWTFNGSDNLSGTLTNIPRQANITGSSNFNDEQNPTISYSNQAGNSVSSLQACIASSNGSTTYAGYRDISKTGSSYTFNLTTTERNALRSAASTNSLSVRFYVKTVIGGNTYYSYHNRTMTIVNANPTFDNFEFEDINETTLALTGDNQVNVNGYSNIKATISTTNKATANKQATMSKYRFTIGTASVDIPYSSSEDVSGVINNAENGTYTVYAIDSRKNATPVPKLASSVIAYEKIYINPSTSNVARNNNQVGNKAILTLNGTFWNDNFGLVTNTIKSVAYQFKKTSSSSWITGTTSITPTTSENTFTFTGEIASDNNDTTWDLEDSYNIRITITDELSSTSVDFILPSAVPTLSLDKDGVGIMCAYDNSIGGKLQVGGKRYFDIDSIFPVGALYLTTDSSFDPNTAFGGTWSKITSKFLYANAGSSYAEGNGTGTSTNNHTLTAAQSGLPNHNHEIPHSTNDKSPGSSWDWGGRNEFDSSIKSYTAYTGGWNASEGHSHKIPYFSPFVWRRTA